MTRTYALKRLLEHGPLTMTEIERIMGGDLEAVADALSELRKAGIVFMKRRNQYMRPQYALRG